MFTFDPRSAAKRVWRFFAFQGESGPAGPSGAPGTRGAPVSGPQHKNSEKKWKVLSRFGKMISLWKITKLFLWTRVRVVFTSEDSFHIKPNDQKEKNRSIEFDENPFQSVGPFHRFPFRLCSKIIMFALITKLVIFWNKTRRNIMIKVMETPCLHMFQTALT